MEKISAVYKIVNEVTGDSYIGSSKNVERRWAHHKCPSTWKLHPNYPLYQDFQKYGFGCFRFQILAPVEPEYLKQVEQEFIELLKPTYNDRKAKGLDIERRKKAKKNYRQTDKNKEYQKKYRQTERGKEVNRKQARKDMQKYRNQLCCYKGETLTLNTLSARFRKAGIAHYTVEAKKYLIK